MRRSMLWLGFSILMTTAVVSSSQTFTKLADFVATKGGNPAGALIQGSDGSFYGTTRLGGTYNYGEVFKITPQGVLTTLYSFNKAIGAYPTAGLVQTADGSFYGTTTEGGGWGSGTVFKIAKGTLATIYNFNYTDGQSPSGELVQGTDGNLYGTTATGGANNLGTVFKMTPTGVLTTLHSFNMSDGAYLYAGLVQGADGAFYGTTERGGTHSAGTLFKVTSQGSFTTLYNFCSKDSCTDGARPDGTLLLGADGNFYGMTYGGGANGGGTVFRITPQGTLTTLHAFCSQDSWCTDGRLPYAGLMLGIDGNFYGTTLWGGAGPNITDGNVFRMTPGGDLTNLYSFNNSSNTNGSHPQGKLAQGTDGNLYGTAHDGGVYGVGTVFRLDVGLHATLTVTTTGNGTVTSTDGYISCGQTCSHTYVSGSNVALTATPAQGWLFAGWTGCDQSNGYSCLISMNGARNVSATFKAIYSLTVSKSGNGLVSSGDGKIYCGGACSYAYPADTLVNLTATPGAGFTLARLSNCYRIQGTVCTVLMSSDVQVTEDFAASRVVVSSLTLKPASVKGGTLSIATLTLDQPAQRGSLGVAITSDHPELVIPPSLVVVPSGQASLSFAVRTIPVRSKTVANITATANASHASATLTLTTGYASTKASSEKGTNNIQASQRRATTRPQ